MRDTCTHHFEQQRFDRVDSGGQGRSKYGAIRGNIGQFVAKMVQKGVYMCPCEQHIRLDSLQQEDQGRSNSKFATKKMLIKITFNLRDLFKNYATENLFHQYVHLPFKTFCKVKTTRKHAEGTASRIFLGHNNK